MARNSCSLATTPGIRGVEVEVAGVEGAVKVEDEEGAGGEV